MLVEKENLLIACKDGKLSSLYMRFLVDCNLLPCRSCCEFIFNFDYSIERFILFVEQLRQSINGISNMANLSFF